MLQLLVGNNNVYTEQEQIFDPPIVATKIRFIPYTSHVRMMCMRVELYGCPWTGEWNMNVYSSQHLSRIYLQNHFLQAVKENSQIDILIYNVYEKLF